MNVFISEQAETEYASNLSVFGRTESRGSRIGAATNRSAICKSQPLPVIGRDRSSLAQGIRSLVADIYLIFCTVEPERIVIVRVLDGHRDIDAEFQR